MILPKMRAFTMQGLCRYLDCSTGYFRTFKLTASEDFLAIITRIEETVYDQKFTGAAAGFLNANLISRDLGLADKKDVTTDGQSLNDKKPVVTLPDGTTLEI